MTTAMTAAMRTDSAAAAWLGIDIGATHMRAVLVDPARRETRAVRMPTPPPGGLAQALAALVARAASHAASFGAVGLSRAAAVDGDGRVTDWPSRPDYLGADLLAPLATALAGSERAGAPAAIRHLDDGMAAAFGEAARAGAEGDDLCALSLGTGVGVGLVSGGRLVQTGDGAGTLGHLPLGLAGMRCRCGRTGCLQATLVDRDIPDTVFTAALVRARDWLAAHYGTRIILIAGGAASARPNAIAAIKGIRLSSMPDHAAALGAALHARHPDDLPAARRSAALLCRTIAAVSA
ncbi:ROK family protein [Stappia indica]|uniref:ROK family protein n=1 Tax=Stappia indica TaxID=538381 RepID=A0A857C2W2_9HYPH|nr:ROK family protein [Stappia indica]QGZ33209.1 ROK family protein [Stappia indica]